MGKSNKKVKSDRINALRKQYDAFLEEDKKRKERNDFILGRLDKMRYTTALVPVRHKHRTLGPRPAVVDHLGYQTQFPSVRDYQPSVVNQSQLLPDIPVKNNEDNYLIQEISKKYILIPKLRTTFVNNYVPTTNQNTESLQKLYPNQDTYPLKDLKSNTNENADWKSKYEILNILKNEEKETKAENYHTDLADVSEHSVHKESVLGNSQDEVIINYNNHVNADVLHVKPAQEYIIEYPEKDLPTDTLHYELPKNNQNYANLITNANTSSENENFGVAYDDQTGAIGNQLQNNTLEYKHSDAPNIDIPVEVTNYETQPESDVNMTSATTDICPEKSVEINGENSNIEDETSVAVDSLRIDGQNVSVEHHKFADSEQEFVDDSKTSPQEDINSDKLVKEMNYNTPSIPDVNKGIFEDGNPAIVSSVQEFAPNNGVQMKTDVVFPEEQTDLNSNVDTIEQVDPVVKQTENPLNLTESIDDFNAQQREMFYTEPTDENYANQQGDEVTPYDLEYSQNEYSQNQEYAYYENTEAGAYPVESNEEVTQQYDPNYEQQYEDIDQGLEQQQYVQQYQEPETGTNQVDPEFEMLQYEQQFENQGKIEETLDVEDGYVEQQLEAEAVELQPNVEALESEKADIENVPVSK